MKKRLHTLLMVFILSIVFITACSAKDIGQTNSDQQNVTVIKHKLGETKIVGTPQRIVALEFSYVDALVKLGLKPVGIADDNDRNLIIKPIRDKIGQYTSVGSRYEPNLEIISSLKPDLILADTERFKGIYQDLSAIAPTLLIDSYKADYKSNLESFHMIAKAVGKEQEGAKIRQDHEQRMNQIAKTLPKNDQRIVLPAVANNEGLFGHSATSFAGSLLQQYGLKNALPMGEAYQKLSLEQLVKLDPDVLFIMKGTEHTVIEEWEKNPLWKNLKAVKHNQVFYVDRSMWSLSRGLIASEEVLKEAKQLLSKHQ